jgi:poly(3-hydroxybutyrate) depolymerase
MNTPWLLRHLTAAAMCVALAALASPARAEGALPAFRLDLTQTTVSGISSGAFMAVQFGVAHSATVSGVAATAGGPYFCAGKDAWAGGAVSKVMARCMQGDPAFPATALGAAEVDAMRAATRDWSQRGLIDSVDNLARQRVWLFHGYNDGIVKKPVSDALRAWYGAFVPASQIFYQDVLRAAHAQVSASCGSTAAKSCNPCATAGGTFINACTTGGTAGTMSGNSWGGKSGALYDAAGAALQFFYGPLKRTDSGALTGRLLGFDQTPYIQRDGRAVTPLRASMANAGYLYVPTECAAGKPCRLHIAFHGCQQQAERIGTTFVTRAGYNEWADANRIVVLYPQTVATTAVPATPFNPQGCWDWWGYSDFGYDMAGHYATRDGVQIAAVWRMVQRLASGTAARATLPANLPTNAAVPSAVVADTSATQVALTWPPVAGAAAYRVYRARDGAAPQPVGSPRAAASSFVDSGLAPTTAYRYVVRSVDSAGREGPASAAVGTRTAALPPACDPYFSLAQNRPVGRDNKPTGQVCP